MRINHLAAIGATVTVGLSTLGWAQNNPVLTARELFHVPAAVKTQPVAKKQTTPPTAPGPIKEFRKDDGSVQIVTASYEGGKPLGMRLQHPLIWTYLLGRT